MFISPMRFRTMEKVEDESKCPPLLSKVGQATAGPNCPCCDSSNTKFCDYNEYNLTQPRYFCKGCRHYWTEGGSLRNVPVGGHSASHRKPQHFGSVKTQILIDRASELKNIGYHGMDGRELGEANESGNPRLPKDAEIRAVVPQLRPMLRSFTNDDDGVQPTTLSDDDVWVQPTTLSYPRVRNYCFTLPRKLVGATFRGSTVSVWEHGGITDIEDGLRYFVGGPNVYQDLRGGASSSRTTNTASTLMEVEDASKCPPLLSTVDQATAGPKIGYHGMDGTELGEAKGKWSWRQPNDAEIRAAVRHSFTNDGDGVQPTTLSDRGFRNYCFSLLSTVSVREHGGITDIEDGLRYFVGGPNVYQDLRGGASSSRTTNTASTLMGDGRRHDQDPRMKEFRNYAYWITPLSMTILVGLLSANKRQPDLLFRSCSSLASGASICGIAMLMLVLIRPSSQSALTCLKMMQYLTIGLLFVAAVLVFTLL